MSIPRFTEDLAIIQKLSDLPNSTEGLTAAELKARFDKAGLLLQKFINEQLVPNIVSKEIPFPATNEIKAMNIYDAILSVQAQVRDAVAGVLVNGSVTTEKLSNELLERIYGGRPWVSIDTPDSADNVAADFPVGQLWLRPRFTVKNAATTAWVGTGCNTAASGHNVTITGTNTVAAVKAVQTLANMGISGDRVFVLFDTGSIDPEITGMTVNINGEGAKNARNGGVFETHLVGTSLSVQFDITWPSTSLANGSAEILDFAVVNTTQILRQMSDAKDMGNWASYLTALQPLTSHTSAAEMFIHASDGEWWPFGFETLAVSRGGTGLAQVNSGALLVGTGGEALQPLEPGEENSVLNFSEGRPSWVSLAEFVSRNSFLRHTSGSYKGTGTKRTIDLQFTPLVLFVYCTGSPDQLGGSKLNYGTPTFDNPFALVNGATVSVYTTGNNTSSESPYDTIDYASSVKLNGSKLEFTTSINDSNEAKLGNVSKKTYNWFALY